MRQNSWIALAVVLIVAIMGLQLRTPSGGLGIVLQDEGSYIGSRPVLNFTGGGVAATENSANNRFDIDFAAGSGDISDVGNVTSGAAFTSTGTAGTSLWFYDLQGRGQLTIADLTAIRTFTLPDATGEVSLLGQTIGDAEVDNNITLTNITQITTRSHTSLSDIGTNTHAQVDTHIADGTIHFTQGSITTLGTIGTGIWQGTTIKQPYIAIDTTAGDANTLTLHDLLTGTPTTNNIPKWNGTNWAWAADETGAGGSGDITDVGDVATGAAFTSTGTAGTSLWFYDPQGRGQLTIANLTAIRTFTLPDATGEITLLGQTIGTAEVESGLTLDTEWDTQGEVETIWGVTLSTDTELTAHTGDTSDPHGATLSQTNLDLGGTLRILESGTTPTLYGTLAVADLNTSGKTYTFPDATGTVITTGNLTEITATGTIASGTWNGTVVGATYGGTGQTTWTLGDLLYSSAANTLAKLSGNTTTTRKFLLQVGNGTISAAPSWDTVTKTDVGLSAVENTALSTWAGSANLTTLGAITSGVWTGTAINQAYVNIGTGGVDASIITLHDFLTGTPATNSIPKWNGTNWAWAADETGGGASHNILSATHTDTLAASVVLGDMMAGNATPLWQRVAGNITTTKMYLSQTGTGAVSALPVWAQIASGDISNSTFVTSVTGTANRITSSGGLTPAIDIASTYVGQASITTLGTIDSGVWQGTTVKQPYIAIGTTVGDANTITLHDLISGVPNTSDVIQWNGTNWVPAAGGGGGAPTGASYVTLGNDATLTAERVLTAGNGISLTDAGANSTVTIANTGVRVLYSDLADRAVTGTTAETDLNTYTLPANTLGTTGGLRIKVTSVVNDATDNKTVKVFLGATVLYTDTATAAADRHIEVQLLNTGTTNSQRSIGILTRGSSSGTTYATAAIDTTAAVIIKTTGTLVNSADTITAKIFSVEILP